MVGGQAARNSLNSTCRKTIGVKFSHLVPRLKQGKRKHAIKERLASPRLNYNTALQPHLADQHRYVFT